MNVFNRDMGDHILYTLLNLSDDKNNNDGLPTEMSGHIKEEIEKFAAEAYSDRQLYDFLEYIATIPVDMFNGQSIGHVSSFIHVLCDVTKYYTRPVVGDKKSLDREICKKNLVGI